MAKKKRKPVEPDPLADLKYDAGYTDAGVLLRLGDESLSDDFINAVGNLVAVFAGEHYLRGFSERVAEDWEETDVNFRAPYGSWRYRSGGTREQRG